MKAFLKRGLVFVGLLLLINFVFYFFVKKFYLNDYVDLTNSVKFPAECNSYVIADSHGISLDADLLRTYGFCNASTESDSYDDILNKVSFLIENKKLSKVLVLSVDNHMLSTYRESTNNYDRSSIYLSYQHAPSTYDFILVRYLKRYITLLNPKDRDVLKQGFLSKVRPKNKETQTVWAADPDTSQLARQRFKQQFPDSQVSNHLSASLKKIVHLCQQHHIQVIGIKFPLSGPYLSVMGNTSYGADDTARKEGIPVLDFSRLYASEPKLFLNQDHLNDSGGRVFSRYLMEHLSGL